MKICCAGWYFNVVWEKMALSHPVGGHFFPRVIPVRGLSPLKLDMCAGGAQPQSLSTRHCATGEIFWLKRVNLICAALLKNRHALRDV